VNRRVGFSLFTIYALLASACVKICLLGFEPFVSIPETDMNNSLIFLAALLFAGLALTLMIAAASRHKKAASGELGLMGALALVETTLVPEGSVIVDGELWRARLRTGGKLERGQMVRVVGASGHLLEVEPAS
jgi:membrane-bound serine protease (ClpP class)